jgi:hypothetical protein
MIGSAGRFGRRWVDGLSIMSFMMCGVHYVLADIIFHMVSVYLHSAAILVFI